MYQLLLLIGIFISGVNCGYYFVTAPNIIRFDNDETVSVSVFGLNYAAVKIWLQYGDQRISEKTVVVANEETPQTTTVKVTENDLFVTEVEWKPSTVQICSEWNGLTQSREVILSYKTGYLIVQTDKPIYTPLQRVKIRTLALDESLRKVDGWQVAIELIDPSMRTMGRSIIENSASGFVERQFKLPSHPEIGIWTVRAYYTGQLETEASSQFEVQEYVLPTYGVEIDVDVPFILRDTASIRVTVRARYVYGKPVHGNARLTLNLKDTNGLSEYILDMTNRALVVNNDNEGSLTEFSIDVADILNSPLLRDRYFPDGSRLAFVATVYESATGKEEATSHEGTIFATEPYIFKFSKSKRNFWPGWKYFLKVELLNAIGRPAEGETIEVKMYTNGVFDHSKTATTDENGHAVLIFQTALYSSVTEFKAETSNKRQESENFRVESYVGSSKIQVECVTDNNKMVMRTYTNIQGDGYTGMLFMVVTRGKIVYTKFKEAANQVSEQIMEDLQEIISPDARLIVFYVNKGSTELVADSVKVEVEKKCRGKGLNLATEKLEVKPGSSDELTVTGSPRMWVGLNVMDKALLVLNNKNVLKKNKMFETLQSHDLGCGDGGGKTSADVFKKTGLTVLTNAKVDAYDLVRNTDGCGKKRRKRYSEQKIHITKRSLVDKGDYEIDLERLADWGYRPQMRTDFRESWLFQLVQLDSNGQATKFLHFPESITEWMIQGIGITPDEGVCIAEDIDIKAFRNVFIQLDLPYKTVRLEHFDVKATIFSYGNREDINKLANIYLEGGEHLCYNSDPGKPSPKISIELPPNSAKTVSFPMIPLIHGLFPIRVSAITTENGIPEVDLIEKRLYVVNEGKEEKIVIHVCLDPSIQTQDCKNDDRVISDVKHGLEKVYKIDLTLPRWSIPQTGSAAAYIHSNLMADIAMTIITGVDSLLQLPFGNGEDTMIRLAPSVYAMTYLKQTKQITEDIEKKGKQWIKDGIDHEVSKYRHPDGSYSIWESRPPSTWLTAFVGKVFCQAKRIVDDVMDERDIKVTIDWLKNNLKNDMPVLHREMTGQINERDPSLTAFVLITLNECGIRSDGLQETIVNASKFLEGIPELTLKKNPYLLAISTYALALADSPKKDKFKTFLHQIQKRDGNYLYWGNPGGKPASAQSVETTAYALLAMIEFNDFKNGSAVVNWLTSQRYASRLFRTLQDTVVGLQALTQYSKAGYSAGVNLSVILLADSWNAEQYFITNDNANVQKVVTKLPVEIDDNILTVKVSGTGSGTMTIDLRYNRPASEEESCPFEITDVEVEDIDDAPIDVNLAKERNCDVCGRCKLDLKQLDDYDSDMFMSDESIEANPKTESYFGRRTRQANRGIKSTKAIKCIRFSVSSKENTVHGMSIINFGIGIGVEIDKSDLEKLMEENQNIARYEMPSNGHGFVIFYLNEVTSQGTNFIFRLKDEFDGDINYRQPSSIKVYDYNNPDWKCTKIYGTGPNRGKIVDFECNKDQKQCQCLQSTCIKPVENEIRRMVKKRAKPAHALWRYTCNSEKANYAVLVEIESLDFNTETQVMFAHATVSRSLHQGIEQLERDDLMTFFWNIYCEQPDLEKGKQYLIIGRDGNRFSIGDREEYRYPLMGTALVLRHYKRHENRLQFSVLDKYQQLLVQRGCQH